MGERVVLNQSQREILCFPAGMFAYWKDESSKQYGNNKWARKRSCSFHLGLVVAYWKEGGFKIIKQNSGQVKEVACCTDYSSGTKTIKTTPSASKSPSAHKSPSACKSPRRGLLLTWLQRKFLCGEPKDASVVPGKLENPDSFTAPSSLSM